MAARVPTRRSPRARWVRSVALIVLAGGAPARAETPGASVVAQAAPVPPELSLAAMASTGPLGMAGERGLCLGLRVPVAKRLVLGAKARWHLSSQRAQDGREYDLHRTAVLFEVAFRYRLGRLELMWIEGAGVGPVLGGPGGADWLAPALMPAGVVAYRVADDWTVGLGGGWLIQWLRLEARRRRTTTNQVELTVARAF